MSDGTFKVSPSFLTQLYTVHGAFMGKFLPLVFVLLSHKDELSYSAMLSRVKELCLSLYDSLSTTSWLATVSRRHFDVQPIETDVVFVTSAKTNFLANFTPPSLQARHIAAPAGKARLKMEPWDLAFY